MQSVIHTLMTKRFIEGDIMGIGDAGILAVGQDIAETTLEMLEQLVDDDSELISHVLWTRM